MEWSIPIQKLDVNSIHISPLIRGQKVVTSISYVDKIISMPSLTILLPSLQIHSYDAGNGQLILDVGDALVLKKLVGVQEYILKAVREQQKSWFPDTKRPDDLYAGFQSMIDKSLLHLYCPIGGSGPYEVQAHINGEWHKSISESMLQPGTNIHVVIRIQGVAFHQNPITGAWTGKFRLQHRILGVFS